MTHRNTAKLLNAFGDLELYALPGLGLKVWDGSAGAWFHYTSSDLAWYPIEVRAYGPDPVLEHQVPVFMWPLKEPGWYLAEHRPGSPYY